MAHVLPAELAAAQRLQSTSQTQKRQVSNAHVHHCEKRPEKHMSEESNSLTSHARLKGPSHERSTIVSHLSRLTSNCAPSRLSQLLYRLRELLPPCS